jgi:hypothetical protein
VGHVTRKRKVRNTYRISVTNSEGKKLLKIARRRWGYIIKMAYVNVWT